MPHFTGKETGAQRDEMSWTKDTWLEKGRASFSHQDPPIRSGWQVVLSLWGNFCLHVCPHTCTMGFWKWGPQEGNAMSPGMYSVDGRLHQIGPARAIVGAE